MLYVHHVHNASKMREPSQSFRVRHPTPTRHPQSMHVRILTPNPVTLNPKAVILNLFQDLAVVRSCILGNSFTRPFAFARVV